MHTQIKKRLKIGLLAIFILLIFWLGAGWLSAWYVTRSHHTEIPATTVIGGKTASAANFSSGDGTKISGWWIPADGPWAVVLFAGIGGNRTHMTDRAELYVKQGFSVLMPDLRGTGMSEGDVVTLGWHERQDVLAACSFVQAQGKDSIGVHGISLGAAAVAYSLHDQPQYEFVVLEHPYDNIEHAWEHRMEWYPLPQFTLSPMRWFTEMRCGVVADSLWPENHVNKIKTPLLYLAGDAEQQIPLAETEKIFNNCGTDDKTLHIFNGAHHEDLYQYAPREYANTLKPFICRFQCQPDSIPQDSI